MSILTVTFNPLDLQLLGSPSVESAVSTTFLYFPDLRNSSFQLDAIVEH